MAFGSLLSIDTAPAVHAKPDVGQLNSEGQKNREKGDQQKRQRQEEENHAHPVPNALGEITGKLIDTTA